MPKVIIFAGANGSGKTTLAEVIIGSSMPFVNADEIKKREKLSSIKAGQKALQVIDEFIRKRQTFAFETTMSGLMLLKRFKQLKKQKFSITVYFLFVYPLILLSERIKERVKKGGHSVREEDIGRRYYRSAKNFWRIYKRYAHIWAVVLNNEYEYKNIAVGVRDVFDVIDDTEFIKFKEVIGHG